MCLYVLCLYLYEFSLCHSQDTKWMTLHMDRCEELGISWPPDVPADLASNQWLQVVPQREREIVAIASMDEETRWVDASQQVTRARMSKSSSSPTVLPGCHLFSFEAGRFLVGRDLMRLQGFPVECLPSSSKWSDRQYADLAGNGFAITCSLAMDIAVLLSVQGHDDAADAGQPCRFLHGMSSTSAGAAAEGDDDSDVPVEFDL